MGRMLLKVLSDPEVEKMHDRTLELLETVGVKVTHDETLKKLAKAGAKVNASTGSVRFPREMVSELLALAPSVAVETGLNGKVLEIGGDNRYYGCLVTDPFIVDYEAGPRRPVLEDIRRHTIVGESLDRVDMISRMQFPVADISGADSCYKTMEVVLTHTSKSVSSPPTSEENCRDWMDVMAVIADAAGLDVMNTPLTHIMMAVTSPLQLHGPNVEMMKMAMERCYPIFPTICPMAGTTSPYTVAGTALVTNAENLLVVLVAQVYKPGHPVFYGAGPSVTDMKTGRDLYYKAEKMLFKIAATQMGKYYNLPVKGEAAGTLTYRSDVQNGAEGALYLLASVVGGQNGVGGLGSLHNAVGMSAEQIVMQCGLADMVEYVARGIDMSDHKLGLSSIDRVGPGGNFLMDDLTLELLRSDEFFESPYLDLTGGYEDDRPGIHEIAHQKVDELVNNYKPTVGGKVQAAIKGFFLKKY
ncbi:MAG: trimethylamine methyltransferase family protein, partial [Phycisphaerae bacterium]|nr:trimethylamine methyltransferase family protein [Phycisphaerae bacterium]